MENIGICHRHGQRLGAQAFPAAGGAGAVGHVFADLGPDVFGVGFFVAALEVAEHPLEGGIESGRTAISVMVMDAHFLAVGAAQDQILLLLGQVFEGFIHVDVIMVRHGLEHLPVVAGVAVLADIVPFHRNQRAIAQRFFRVNHPVRVDFELCAEALTVRTSPMRGVKGEGAGFDLGQGNPVFGAGEIFGKKEIGIRYSRFGIR